MHHLCSQLKKRACLNVDQRQSKQECREERRKEWSLWSHAGGDGVQQAQCSENWTSPSPLSEPSNAIHAGPDISCGRPCELDDHWLKAASCFWSSSAGSGTRPKNLFTSQAAPPSQPPLPTASRTCSFSSNVHLQCCRSYKVLWPGCLPTQTPYLVINVRASDAVKKQITAMIFTSPKLAPTVRPIRVPKNVLLAPSPRSVAAPDRVFHWPSAMLALKPAHEDD